MYNYSIDFDVIAHVYNIFNEHLRQYGTYKSWRCMRDSPLCLRSFPGRGQSLRSPGRLQEANESHHVAWDRQWWLDELLCAQGAHGHGEMVHANDEPYRNPGLVQERPCEWVAWLPDAGLSYVLCTCWLQHIAQMHDQHICTPCVHKCLIRIYLVCAPTQVTWNIHAFRTEVQGKGGRAAEALRFLDQADGDASICGPGSWLYGWVPGLWN